MQQLVVAAVGVHQDNFLQAITRNLAANVIQQTHNQLGLDGDRASAVAGLENLGEDEIWKDDRRLRACRSPAQLAPNEHVGAQRQVVAMPLDTGQRQETDTVRVCDRLCKLVARQLFAKGAA